MFSSIITIVIESTFMTQSKIDSKRNETLNTSMNVRKIEIQF